jgi:hypothetical protein
MSEDVKEDVKEESYVEHMGETGELEFEDDVKDEPETDETEQPKTETPKYVIDGNEVTEEDIKSWKKDSQNKSEWQKSLTQKNQAVAEEKRTWETQLSKLKEEAKGDTTFENTLGVLEDTRRELDELRKRDSERNEREKAMSDREAILKMKLDAEKRLGVKLPDLDDPEFKAYVDEVTGGNPLYWAAMAKGLGKVKGEKPQQVLRPATDSDGESSDSEYLEGVKAVARKAGLDTKKVLRHAR